MTPSFQPGRNIAMKVPAHEYAATVSFYRNMLGFKELSSPLSEETPRFAFGDKVLWIDRVAGISQAEIWLEVVTDDIEQASEYLQQKGCQRRDESSPYPKGSRRSGYPVPPTSFIWSPPLTQCEHYDNDKWNP